MAQSEGGLSATEEPLAGRPDPPPDPEEPPTADCEPEALHEVADDEQEDDRSPRSTAWPNRQWWAVAITLTVVAIALGLALGNYRRTTLTLDPADEEAHYAYVVSLRSGHLPRFGDTLSANERRMIDCQGVELGIPAPCAGPPGPVRAYPAQGYQYEAQQPPLGYLPYLLAANPNAPPKQALADARRGGEVWMALSGLLLLAFAALDSLGLLGLAALLATSLLDPVFSSAAGTVNNDAAGVAAGALALLAWSWAKRVPKGALWFGIVAGVLIGLTKGTFIVAPLALAVAALVDGGGALRSRAGWRDVLGRNRCAIAMLGASVVSFAAFAVVQDLRATVSPSVVLHALLGAAVVATLQPSTVGFGFTSGLNLFVPDYAGAYLNILWGIAAFGVVVGLCAIPQAGAERRGIRALAAGTLVGVGALAVGWPLLVYLQGHYNYVASVRYCIPLLPFIGYVLARGCNRYGTAIVGVALPLACAGVQLSIGKY